jgi:hypothetical protein
VRSVQGAWSESPLEGPGVARELAELPGGELVTVAGLRDAVVVYLLAADGGLPIGRYAIEAGAWLAGARFAADAHGRIHVLVATNSLEGPRELRAVVICPEL